jgi:hypothetical protein
MRKHHTKNKGDLGILKAQLDMTLQGYMILHPLTEHSEFDLVAYKDGSFLRVQVKYRAVNNAGVIAVPFKTSWADKNGTHEQYINKNEIDIFCVYCPDTDECYYFRPKDFRKGVNLRINPPKNPVGTIHYAKEYTRVP